MSDMSPKTYKSSESQDESPNKPWSPPPLSTYVQSLYYKPSSTPTTTLTPAAGSSSYPYGRSSQAWDRPLQCDSLHDPRRLSNYPIASGGTAAMAFSEKVLSMYGGKNLDAIMKKSDENLQHKSLVTKESEEKKKGSSISKTNVCEASESMGSPYEGQDANNAYESTKIVFKDFPSTKKQQCNMMLGKGQDTQKEISLKMKRSSASHHFAANPTKLNQNLGTDLNASGTNPQLEKLESEIRKERKRQSNKRSRMSKEESEIRKERKRQSNKRSRMSKEELCEIRKERKRQSYKRSRMRKEKEYEELLKSVDNMKVGNSELKKELLRVSKDCEELTNENDSISEELDDQYGPE